MSESIELTLWLCLHLVVSIDKTLSYKLIYSIADCIDLANSKQKVLCTWWVSNQVVVSNASTLCL